MVIFVVNCWHLVILETISQSVRANYLMKHCVI